MQCNLLDCIESLMKTLKITNWKEESFLMILSHENKEMKSFQSRHCYNLEDCCGITKEEVSVNLFNDFKIPLIRLTKASRTIKSLL